MQNLTAFERDPCAPFLEKILNAMEAADYNIRPLHKFVKEYESCRERRAAEHRGDSRAAAMYHLSQHLDQQKHKRK